MGNHEQVHQQLVTRKEAKEMVVGLKRRISDVVGAAGDDAAAAASGTERHLRATVQKLFVREVEPVSHKLFASVIAEAEKCGSTAQPSSRAYYKKYSTMSVGLPQRRPSIR
jgi:hypothetical protein